MAGIHLDHNVSQLLAPVLRERGHTVLVARQSGLERVSDGLHLLVAASNESVLVTHRERDFLLLHDAWLRWSQAWQIAPRHAGIIVLPQERYREPSRAAAEIEALLPIEANRLWTWRPSRGWIPYPEMVSWLNPPLP